MLIGVICERGAWRGSSKSYNCLYVPANNKLLNFYNSYIQSKFILVNINNIKT